MSDEHDDYKVGYKRPPRQHRYQPGQSGNPGGRPKKLNLGIPELIEKYLETPVSITERGKSRRVTARQAIVHRLQHGAASGEPKAFELLLELYKKAKPTVGLSNIYLQIHFVEPKPRKEEE